MFFSEHQEMFAKMMVAITFHKASKGNRAHLMFLSALMIEIHERIPVGFAHSFDLPGEFYLPIISQACIYINVSVMLNLIYCWEITKMSN